MRVFVCVFQTKTEQISQYRTKASVSVGIAVAKSMEKPRLSLKVGASLKVPGPQV